MAEEAENNVMESPSPAPKSTPRLMITKMVLENFKSYAGKQEIGPFHHCFSSVIGPNGSGKSNVIDAMLFVFGKRAKQLRLNKVSELIHKSDQCSPTAATVTVYMEEIIDLPPPSTTETGRESYTSQSVDPLPYEIVPNSQVILSRTAKSDNSSVYKLNGKTTQFRDINAFLNTKGIDLEHNRFLILQGEVELIAMMPPKAKNEGDNDGLLEYLEDIIGSHTFVPATQEAAEKIEALGVTRQERLNRVKAAQNETKSLEGAKKEAQQLLRKERAIRQEQSKLYQRERLIVQRKSASLATKKEELDTEIEQYREKTSGASSELEELMERHEEFRVEYNKANDELEKTQQEFSAFERRDIKLREAVKHTKQTIKDWEKKVAEHEKKQNTAQRKHDSAVERIPELEKQIEDLKASKLEEEAILEEIQEETRHATHKLRSELEAKTEALAPLMQDRTARQTALDTAQTELNLIQDATREAQKRLEDATQELANLEDNHEKKKEALREHQTTIDESKKQLDSLQTEDHNLADEEAQLSRKHKSQLARTEDAKAALQSKGGPKSSPSVQAILKAARSGGPLAKVGVLGRLGDMATIDAKYDVAVSTACGCLDYVVVQTTAGAQRCIEFLRHHNIGRANFIPLDKMKKGAHDRVVETPERAPRLLELIQPLQKHNYASVMSAVFLGVSDTLVAPDLETATRWAYDFGKRWRVVTLDGKLLETAGTMTGGGKHVRKGGMKLSNSRATASAIDEDDSFDMDVKTLEIELGKTENRLREIRQQRKDLTDQINKLKRQIKDVEKRLPKLTMEIESFHTTRENLTNLIPQLKERSMMSSEQKQKEEEMAEKIELLQGELDDCINQASELESEVHKLQKSILDAGGKRLKTQSTKCEDISTELKESEKELSSSKVAITSSQKAMKKASEAKANAEKELEEARSLLEEKQQELKSLEDDAFAVTEAFEKVKELAAEKKSELDSIANSVEKAKKSLAGLQGKEVELVSQVDAITEKLSQYSDSITAWDRSLDELIETAKKTERDLWEDEEEEASGGEDEPDNTADEVEMKDAEIDDKDDEELKDVDMDVNEGEESDEQQSYEASITAFYPTYNERALDRYDSEELRNKISKLETERKSLANDVHLGAIAEYRKKEKEYMARIKELDEVTEERNLVRREFEELRRKRLEMFMEGFNQISYKLKEMYQMITLGGDAELELVDSLDPFAEGIVFSVRPPKKSWKNISNLSGGEKTLSSLALVFALHHYKPTPLYVMDEVDAALDYKNVSIVGNYIKERTRDAQFIIISLRNNMFELADRLVGVYKTFNCSKSIAVNPASFGIECQQNGISATPALRNRSNSMAPNQSTSKMGGGRPSVPSTPMVIAPSNHPSPKEN